MVVRNNYFWLPDNPKAAFIANGDMAKIVRVRREEERYGLRFAEVNLEFLDFPEVGTVTCKIILDTAAMLSPNLKLCVKYADFNGRFCILFTAPRHS